MGSIGELTAVASANRGVRGVLRDSATESLDDVLGREVIVSLDALVGLAELLMAEQSS